MSDGTIVIDTKIDNSGAKKGTGDLKAEAAKLAHEYKKSGMSSSQAWKKAWSDIKRDSKSGSSDVKGSIQSISSIAKSCAATLGGLFILDKVKDYAVQVVKTGISYNAMSEQAQVAWTTILGSQSKASQMMKDIEKYAASTPFSKMGVDAMAKQLTNAGFQGKSLFDQLTKFGNMGSAFGIQEDSLKEMVRQYSQVQQSQVAYTEDLNILQDRGIPIFKALAEVMGVPVSQVKKLASEGKVTADVYNKAIDSIANKTTGAMEGQSKTFSGMMSTLGDNLSMLAGALAKPIFDKMKDNLEVLMPKLEEFTKVLGEEGFGAALDSIAPGLGDLIKNAGLLGSAILGAVGALKIFIGLQAVVGFISGLAGAIKTYMGAVKGATLCQTLFNMVILPPPLTIVIGLIGLLVGAFIYLWNTSEGFRSFWIGLWDTIKNACITAWNSVSTFFTDTIPNVFNGIINFFKSDWKEILVFIVNPFVGAFMLAYKHCEGFRTFIDNLVNNIKMFFVNGFNNMKTSVVDFANNALLTLQTWGTNVWNFFTVTIPAWITSIFNWFNELPAKIGFALGFVVTKLIMWGVEVFTYLQTNVPIWIASVGTWFSELPGKIWTWLCDTVNKVINWGSQMWENAKIITRKFILDCILYISQLPDKIWTWLCNTINKVVAWGSQMWERAKAIATQFVSNCINYISQLPGKIWTWLCNTVNKVVNWGSNLWNAGKNAAKRLVDAVVNTVKSIPGQMVSIGRNIVEGVWKGITGAAGWFKSKVNSFFGGIVDGAKAALGIHSPARKMIPVGQYTVEGTEVGMSKQFPKMQDKFKDKVHGLVSEMKAKVQSESVSLGSSIVSTSTFNTLEKNNFTDNSQDVSGVISSLDKTLKSLKPKIYLDGKELIYSNVEFIKESLDEHEKRNTKFAY